MKLMRLEGNPLSPGFASGGAVVYDDQVECKLTLPHRAILQSDVHTECERIDDALEQSKRDLQLIEQMTSDDSKQVDISASLSAHAAVACGMTASVKQQIGCDLVNVEQALDLVLRDWICRLQELEYEDLRQRERVVRDVGQRMMRNLAGTGPWSDRPLPSGSVVVARELLPSNWHTLEWLASFPSEEASTAIRRLSHDRLGFPRSPEFQTSPGRIPPG